MKRLPAFPFSRIRDICASRCAARLPCFSAPPCLSGQTEAAMLHTPVTSDLFHEIPGNPVPDGATAGFLTARDGMRLRYARFGAIGRPLKGTVIILPGRNECIEKYF